MSFKHPEILFALFALLVPVIIHLFNFRRYKKVLFSNIEFLKHIKSETRKQNELKHLLVLFFRMLAIAFLVLLFAGPEWDKEDGNDKNLNQSTRIVYLDNSFSMSAEDNNTRLFDLAIEKARNLAENSSSDTRFVLLTNDATSGKRTLTRENFLTELDQLKLSPESRDLSDVLRSEQKYTIDNNIANREVFIFSDFQKSTADLADIDFDTTAMYYFLTFEQNQVRNIYVDSCYFSDPVLIPGKRVNLFIRIKNGSDLAYEKIPLKLTIDGKQKGVAGVNLKARSEEVVPVTFVAGHSGWHEGVVSIEDSPVAFDNDLYLAFQVKDKIMVLELYDKQGNPSLQKFYESDSIFEFKAMNYRQLDLNALQQADLVILNGLPEYSNGLLNQLKELLDKGGNLMFFPSVNTSLASNNVLLGYFQAGEFTSENQEKSKVSRLNMDDELFQDAIEKIPENADLPVVNRYFRLKYATQSGVAPLVYLLNGDDFMAKKNVGNGQLYLLTVPMGRDFSNFSSHLLFVPVMYGATFSNKSGDQLYYTIGKDNRLGTIISSSNSAETPFTMNKTGTNYSFIPEQQFVSGKLNLGLYGNVTEDGMYNLQLNDSVFGLFAFNYNRDESKMEFYTDGEIVQMLEIRGIDNAAVVDSEKISAAGFDSLLQKESELWKLFLILALLMILGEIVILRYWK